MIWDLLQQMQINDAGTAADRATSRAESAANDVTQMRRSVETLSLTCAAMWELLSEKLGVSEQELLDRIQQIDLRDGKLDRKRNLEPIACPSCSRPNRPERERCMYCSQPLPARPFG